MTSKKARTKKPVKDLSKKSMKGVKGGTVSGQPKYTNIVLKKGADT